MNEITMFAALRPEPPADAELQNMRVTAWRKFAVATESPPKAGGRRWRRPALAGGLVATAAGAAAVVMAVTSGGTAVGTGYPAAAGTKHLGTVVTSAWTVRANSDGTVTVDILQLVNPERLQTVLRSDGVNVFVRSTPQSVENFKGTPVYYDSCKWVYSNRASQATQRAVWTQSPLGYWTIHPSAMPKGSALFLTGSSPLPTTNGTFSVASMPPVVMTNDRRPVCVPVGPPPEGGTTGQTGKPIPGATPIQG